jgi:hypothetical protein
MFQQEDTFLYSILFPVNGKQSVTFRRSRWVGTADSPTTTEGHRLFVTTRCCNYSLFELLMMGECFTRNIYSRLQGIKYCTRKVSSCWNIFKNKLCYSCYFVFAVPNTQVIIRLISHPLKMLPFCRKLFFVRVFFYRASRRLIAKAGTCRTIYNKTLQRCSCAWLPTFHRF